MIKNRRGLSLIELVLTVALVGIVIQVIYSVFFVSATSYSVSTNKGFSQQDVRLVADFVANELKYVSGFSADQSDFSDDYYTLSLEEIDGKNNIVKTFYSFNDQDTEDTSDDLLETTIEKSLVIDLEELSILTSNINMEVINIKLSQSLNSYGFGNKSGSFELPLSVSLINNVSDFKEVDVDLVAGEKLYYSVSGLTETKREILISQTPTNDENDDTNTDTTQYTVSFVTNNDNSLDPISGLNNSNITLVSTLLKSGYVFNGWYENSEFTGTKYSGSYVIKGDATLYAKWVSSDEAVTLYKSGSNIKVTSWGNNVEEGSENTTFEVTKNKSVTVRLPVIYKKGTSNGNIGELNITVNGWSGATGYLEVTADEQYIIISGTSAHSKGDVLDIAVIVMHDEITNAIEYNFKLESQ